LPYEREPVAEETVQKLLDAQREQHVVLRELEEMRPAQPGDMVTVVMASDLDEDEDDEDDLDEDEDGDVLEGAFADEVVLEDDAATEDDEDDAGDEDDEVPAGAFADEVALEDDTEFEAGADEDDEDDLDDVDDEDDEDEETIALVEGRVRPEIYQALIGAQPGETRTVTIHYGEDEEDEELRGRDVTYTITVKNVQERLLPEWEELPTLAEFEGDIDAMRANARERLERAAEERARRALLDTFIERAMADTSIDLPDAMIEERADELFHGQAAQFARYGLTEEQYLTAISKSHDEAVAELREPAEQDVRRQLILREFIRREGLQLNDQDIANEIEHFLEDYDASRREEMRPLVENPNMRTMLASSALDRKLRDRLVEIASGGRETGAVPARPYGRSRVYASGARIERAARDLSIAGSDGSGEPVPAIETTGAVGALEETGTGEVDMVKEESVS